MNDPIAPSSAVAGEAGHADDLTDDLTDDQYVVAVFDRLGRIGRSSRFAPSVVDDDDRRQRCIVKLLAALPRYRATYPSPHAMAAALARTAGVDLARAERVQCGLGARSGGERSVVPIVDGDRLHDLADGTDRFSRIDDRDQLHAILHGLGPTLRRVAWLVWVEGWSITDAASLVGWSREHTTRRLSAIRRAPHGRSHTIESSLHDS